jgi:hypothetical protein
MKRLGLVGLCLATLAAMSMVASAAVMAATPLWEQCSEGGSATKYSSSGCSKAEAGGKWQWKEVTGTEKFKGSFLTLTLKDTKITEKEGSEIRCTKEAKEEGTVGPYNGGLVIEKVEVKEAAKNCARVEGPCKAEGVEKVEAAHLPWQEEFGETEGKLFTTIEPFGAGEPGWDVTCNTSKGSTSDTCTSEELTKWEGELLENVSSEGTVIGTLEKLHKSKCSIGGSESGVMEGRVKLEDSKDTAVSLQDTPVSIDAVVTAGPLIGTTPTCIFTAAGQECTIEVKNLTVGEEMKIEVLAVRGTNAGKFELKPESCAGARLEPRNSASGTSCFSKIKPVGASEGLVADFYVEGKSRGTAMATRWMHVGMRW